MALFLSTTIRDTDRTDRGSSKNFAIYQGEKLMDTKETVTPDDLDRIFIRAQTPEGRWVSIDVKSCSDAQFDTWAKSRLPIQGEDAPWGLEERADFCNTL